MNFLPKTLVKTLGFLLLLTLAAAAVQPQLGERHRLRRIRNPGDRRRHRRADRRPEFSRRGRREALDEDGRWRQVLLQGRAPRRLHLQGLRAGARPIPDQPLRGVGLPDRAAGENAEGEVRRGRERLDDPKEVREKLGAGPSDVLQWEVVGDHARVTVAPSDLLSLQGRFKVGPGDPVEDVRKARELMGTEDL
jgi:hypothetical protein